MVVEICAFPSASFVTDGETQPREHQDVGERQVEKVDGACNRIMSSPPTALSESRSHHASDLLFPTDHHPPPFSPPPHRFHSSPKLYISALFISLDLSTGIGHALQDIYSPKCVLSLDMRRAHAPPHLYFPPSLALFQLNKPLSTIWKAWKLFVAVPVS